MIDTQRFKQRKIKFKPRKKFNHTTNIYDLFIELKLAMKVRINELHLLLRGRIIIIYLTTYVPCI